MITDILSFSRTIEEVGIGRCLLLAEHFVDRVTRAQQLWVVVRGTPTTPSIQQSVHVHVKQGVARSRRS